MSPRAISLVLFATLSCGGVGDDLPPPGYLLVEWTVADGNVTRDCRDFGVDALDVVVLAPDGYFITEFQAPCEDFRASIDLFPGSYVIDAVLVDSTDFALTTNVTGRVDIFAYDTTRTILDFPANSFY